MVVGCVGVVVTKKNVHDKEWEEQMNVAVVAKASLKLEQDNANDKRDESQR